MTQREKIEMLKSTIIFLYEKEGRSKSYISKLLEVDRKTLINSIKEWGLVQANVKRLSPSNQKFANKNRQLIKSRLDNNISQIKIAEELGVTRDYLRNIIEKDDILNKANQDYINRIKISAEERKNQLMNDSKFDYNFIELEGEEWKEILGYEDYYISNMGRIKKYTKSYDTYHLIMPYKNERCMNRLYVRIKDKNLQVARLVGFAFVDGYSEENNTIDHIDGDCTNNRFDNLAWVTQGENNKRAYDKGRPVNKAYQKNGNFKKIIVDDKYEFKTIVAVAKFLNVSPTQIQRYLSGECSCEHKIKLIY